MCLTAFHLQVKGNVGALDAQVLSLGVRTKSVTQPTKRPRCGFEEGTVAAHVKVA